MFLKFVQVNDVGDRDNDYTIECSSYTSQSWSEKIEIVVHHGGKESFFVLSQSPPGFQECFVMNSEGKTIDRFNRFNSELVPLQPKLKLA